MEIRQTEAVIDLDHLIHNVAIFRSWLNPGQFFCPMVKANAYGHGAAAVARVLEKNGIQDLGVSLIEEGLELRTAGVACDILTFGLFDRGGAEIVDAKLTPVVSTFEQLNVLAETKRSLSVHVKIDTGMGRLGFAIKEIDSVVAFFEKNPHLKVTGILTHLHSAEDVDRADGLSQKQLAAFRLVTVRFQKWHPIQHVWTTAALISLQKRPADLNEYGGRPGLGIYGVTTTPHDVALKPVMSLRSRVEKINSILPGQTVSYGGTWSAKEPSLVGVVPIGYADGIHRILSNVGQALVHGQLVPIVGRVCMDYVMLNLTKLKNQKLLGTEVTFFGEDSKGNQYSATAVADLAQTAPWEILTSVSARVPRRFVGAST